MDDKRPGSPFLSPVRDTMRALHYSYRTEDPYLFWVRRFIRYHSRRHPQEMAEPEVAAFLSHLAVDRHVAPNTQAQALNALVFLYRHVLRRPLGEVPGIVRAPKRQRIPIRSIFTAYSRSGANVEAVRRRSAMLTQEGRHEPVAVRRGPRTLPDTPHLASKRPPSRRRRPRPGVADDPTASTASTCIEHRRARPTCARPSSTHPSRREVTL